MLFAYSNSGSIYKITEGTITFVSEASFETVTAKSEKLNGLLDTTTQEFAFYVANNSFEGFNSLLQREHFNESYVESEKNPRSLFTGKIIEKIIFNKSGTYIIRAKGILNIHGVEQERIIKCELIIENNLIKVNSDFTVFLADHDITIPKIVFDKISPEIKIHVQATMHQKTE
ncbi:hypothetical protein LBMAG27_14040 [Bacteroidota bacterium]|nr:hypothetical protein LBMAG27_14040 [Bacteroidota bacterium]